MNKLKPTLDLPPFIPPKRPKRRSYLTILLTSFVLVLFGLVIASSYQNVVLNQDTEVNIMNSPIVVPTVMLETADQYAEEGKQLDEWQTYTNTLYNYRLQYPSSWEAKGIEGDSSAEILDVSDAHWLEITEKIPSTLSSKGHIRIIGRSSIPEHMKDWDQEETTLNDIPAISLISTAEGITTQVFLLKNLQDIIALEIQYTYKQEDVTKRSIEDILKTIEFY